MMTESWESAKIPAQPFGVKDEAACHGNAMDTPLPHDLQHLRNIINGAKNQPNHCESILRRIIKSAADEAPLADVIRIAETILQCGVDVEKANLSRFN